MAADSQPAATTPINPPASTTPPPRPPAAQTADGHMGLLTKLVLQQAQAVRALNSAVFTTYILDASLPSVSAAQSAARKYSEEVMRIGKGHTLGPPHSHIVAAFLEQSMTDLAPRIQAMGPGHRESAIALKLHNLVMSAATPDAVSEIVSHFIVKDVYKDPEDQRQRVRISFALKVSHRSMLRDADLSPPLLNLAMCWIMSELGGAMKANTAPKGPMERAAEKVLGGRKPARRR